jgi:hypothetical protein
MVHRGTRTCAQTAWVRAQTTKAARHVNSARAVVWHPRDDGEDYSFFRSFPTKDHITHNKKCLTTLCLLR